MWHKVDLMRVDLFRAPRSLPNVRQDQFEEFNSNTVGKKIKYLQYFPFEDPSGVRQIQTPLEGEDVLSGMGLVIEHYWQKN